MGESLILRNTTHQGPVRELDFNPIQTNLLSSGATNGEVRINLLFVLYLLFADSIADLHLGPQSSSKPYSLGTRSSKLDEITSLA